MDSFKRNQVEDAICSIKGGTRQEITNRIKRLLDTDRNLGADRRSREEAPSQFAFYSDAGAGSGVEVWFQEYEAFAILIAVNLLEHGFPQRTCVEIVRRLRSSLKVEHGRILRQPPRPFDLKSAKSGQLATDVADPVFIIVTYERGARDKGECNPVQIAICKGEHALMKRIKSAGAGMTSTVMEVAAAAHSFHNTLLQTQPSRRGRPSS